MVISFFNLNTILIQGSQGSTNAIATPLVDQAYKLHCKIYHYFYSHPLKIYFEAGKVSVKKENIFTRKYVPWLLGAILITSIIGFNTNFFLLLIKLFRRDTPITTTVLVFLVMFTSCSFFQWTTYAMFCKAREIEPALNQLFRLERKCKFQNITSKKI